jgi:hypothetical protein
MSELTASGIAANAAARIVSMAYSIVRYYNLAPPDALITGTRTGTPENHYRLGSPRVERFAIAE